MTDDAEAMRAKCEAIAREARYKEETNDLESGYNAACEDIADTIAALRTATAAERGTLPGGGD